MSKYDWETVQARWEAGESANSISRDRDMPSRQAIDLHAKNEYWQKHENPQQVVALANPEDWEQLSDKQKVAVNAFALGCKTFKQAAIRANVSDSTLRRWRDDEGFRRLCEAARLAKRDAYVARIESHGERDWRADAFLLKSLHAEEFGQQNQVSTVGNQFNILGGLSLGIERSTKDVIEGESERLGEAGREIDQGRD